MPTPGKSMRTVLSALSVLLAVVLAAVAVPALWVERNIVDESGFVRLFSPLREDRGLFDALGASIAATAVSASNVPERLQPAAQELAAGIVDGITRDARFPAAWDETLRESHAANFAPDAPADAVSLELRPLADLVLARVGESLGVDLPESGGLAVQAGSAQQRAALTAAQDAAALSGPLCAGAALSLVLGLLAARRRGVALAWAGLGLLVTAAVLGAGTFLVSSLAGAQAGSGTVSTVFAQRAGQLVADGFAPWNAALALVGAALFVIGGILGARRRRRLARR
ncbi:hypothetical protein [Sinomonas mesophila]|uniref:hypothetical protein n=1 Tax=Sinomonas mesophila TaxID=1531955 RepID=UPI0011154E1B|nr:hypothetical protein [Sinomonas mesophila]